MSQIGIGLVGAGMIGQMCHLANFISEPACRVVALADLRPELAKAAADKFGVPRVYRTHYELLNDDEVTGVVVATRRRATGPIVLDALDRGRHVLSEKPMAHTAAQAERLVAGAARRNSIYSIGYMKRHDAGVARAVTEFNRLRADRSWGAIISARAWCFGGDTGAKADEAANAFVMTQEERPHGITLWDDGPNWMPPAMRPIYDAYLNVYSHIINLARFLLGPVATMKESRILAFPRAELTLDFEGLPCAFSFDNQTSGPWREGIEIRFERGGLTLTLPPPFSPNREGRVELASEGRVTRLPEGTSWAFRRQASAFVADIARGRRPLALGADSVADISLSEQAWRRYAEALSAPN